MKFHKYRPGRSPLRRAGASRWVALSDVRLYARHCAHSGAHRVGGGEGAACGLPRGEEMITQCPYCQLNTAGQHEWNCPCHANTYTLTVNPDQYIWIDGRRYRLVLDNPPERIPGLRRGCIGTTPRLGEEYWELKPCPEEGRSWHHPRY